VRLAGLVDASPPQRRPAKSAEAFRTISEVAQELDVPQHVLRFWESRFPQIRPLKRAGGRRYYRPEDVVLLRRIRQCLYEQGYTIKGVQKLLRDGALKGPDAPAGDADGASLEGATEEAPAVAAEDAPDGDARQVLAELRTELAALREALRKAQA
jgi:DNA-binding transcriptional MerR regulator